MFIDYSCLLLADNAKTCISRTESEMDLHPQLQYAIKLRQMNALTDVDADPFRLHVPDRSEASFSSCCAAVSELFWCMPSFALYNRAK